jgi:hypothetical protein
LSYLTHQSLSAIISCGYTGEDGFELAMPAEHAVSIASKLLSDPTVNPTVRIHGLIQVLSGLNSHLLS